MSQPAAQAPRRLSIGKALSWFSLVVVPLGILALTLLSLFVWRDADFTPGAPVKIQVFEERPSFDNSKLSPEQALATLASAPAVPYQDTLRSENFFWFSFAVDARLSRLAAELNSRHAVNISCWDANTLELLGSGTRASTSGALFKTKAGFSIHLDSSKKTQNLLCRAQFIGPARVGVLQWDLNELNKSILGSARGSGMLDGGMGILAGFVLVMGIINKDKLYVIFFAWLITNLRMAALSAGWDTHWFGQPIPPEYLTLVRQLTMAFYYALMSVFFMRLFKEDLKKVGSVLALKINQWSAVPILLLSVALPYQYFLPLIWSFTFYNLGSLLFYMVKILRFSPSRTAFWYAASYAITVLSTANEVIAAAFGAKNLIGSINSVTAALFSSFLAALAIAEQMRQVKLERTSAQHALSEAYENSPIGLFTLSLDGHLIRANPAFARMLRLSSPLQEWRWFERFDARSFEQMTSSLRDSGSFETETRALMDPTGFADADERWFMVKASGSNGSIEGSLQDITQRVLATDRLRYLTEHDPLTGALNRRGLMTGLEKLRESLGEKGPLALAYMDLDRFKLINDLYGHASGDLVLMEVKKRLSESLPDGHLLARVGGDEFVMALPGIHFQTAQRACSQALSSILSSPFLIGEKAFRVRATMGVVEVSVEIANEEAISAADQACREGRRDGRESIVAYGQDAPVFKERHERKSLMAMLSADTVPDGLFLVMQPIMSLKNPYGSLNFEVLLRMRRPDGSVASAWSIISTAESNGRIALIDRWVLSTTLAWIDQHYDQLIKRTQFICINLSGGSLNDERFTEDAFAMLGAHRRAASLLCLEVTESVAIHDLNNTKQFIERARSFGSRIAIDDFGAGYSSFSYLKDLPADVLKIDGAFVKGSTTSTGNLAIVSAIAGLAGDFGMQSIAEWAEDLATVQAMAELGVDYLQGFALAMPMAPEELLGASSSADFIKDPAIAAFVRLLAANNGDVLAPPPGHSSLH